MHHYHCHFNPLAEHTLRACTAFIVDPKQAAMTRTTVDDERL
jgi:hypothetical protein